jgi:radical S-adenosyl methionine domain-containing protein 2
MLAKQKGFKTSLITNGSYLLNDKFDLPKNVLDMVGISFDSQSYDVRRKIGRISRKGSSLNSSDLKLALKKLIKTQQGLKTKINTVVNELNYQENFSDFISEVKPYKWKVFHVMPYGKEELLISNKQFNHFVNNHSHLGLPIFAESNTAMTESYIMIDPKGRFYQNSAGRSGYQFSECINDVGAERALKQINFDFSAFIARYLPTIPAVLIDEEVTL